MQGYGVFWAIIEDLYNNANALRTDYDGIAYDLRSDSDVVASVINDFDLFVFDGDFFGSKSVQERLEQRNSKSESARKSASYRWKNANALQTQSEGNAKKERKGKEIKGNKIYYRENISLSEKEHTTLVSEFGTGDVNKFYDYLSAYKIEKSYKTKSDYLTIKRWVVDAANKQNKTTSQQNGYSTSNGSNRPKSAYELELEKKRKEAYEKTQLHDNNF